MTHVYYLQNRYIFRSVVLRRVHCKRYNVKERKLTEEVLTPLFMRLESTKSPTSLLRLSSLLFSYRLSPSSSVDMILLHDNKTESSNLSTCVSHLVLPKALQCPLISAIYLSLLYYYSFLLVALYILSLLSAWMNRLGSTPPWIVSLADKKFLCRENSWG